MFSSRLRWDAPHNRLTAALEAKRQAGAPVLDLTESNPTRAGLSYPGETLAALADGRSLLYEPQPAGSPEARETAAAYYRARGIGASATEIAITASTSEAYAYLFKMLADPGDEVLVPRPSYPLFEFLASLESVRVSHYPLRYDGRWRMDLDALEGAISGRTRAIVVVNPNNPTGSFVKRGEAKRLTEVAAARGLAIISDEVFSDYGFGEDEERVTTLASAGGALTFCLSGLSKVAGLPQMKLGWILVRGPGAADAMARIEWIADTYLSVGTPVQHALPRLLEAGRAVQRQIAERTGANLAWLRQAIGRESACAALDVEGGWYVTLRIPRTHSEEEWTLALLERENVLVQPGYFYDFESEAYLTLSLLTAPDVFREGASRLLAAIERG